jgi:hypothetical protein
VLNPIEIDLWIQVTGDANWGPEQVNSKEGPEVKSRKISFGNAANYHLAIWKNNGGKQGPYVGEFDHKVRYNAGGNRDALQLTIITIGGEKYLKAYSVRQLAEIAILIWVGAGSEPTQR